MHCRGGGVEVVGEGGEKDYFGGAFTLGKN